MAFILIRCTTELTRFIGMICDGYSSRKRTASAVDVVIINSLDFRFGQNSSGRFFAAYAAPAAFRSFPFKLWFLYIDENQQTRFYFAFFLPAFFLPKFGCGASCISWIAILFSDDFFLAVSPAFLIGSSNRLLTVRQPQHLISCSPM